MGDNLCPALCLLCFSLAAGWTGRPGGWTNSKGYHTLPQLPLFNQGPQCNFCKDTSLSHFKYYFHVYSCFLLARNSSCITAIPGIHCTVAVAQSRARKSSAVSSPPSDLPQDLSLTEQRRHQLHSLAYDSQASFYSLCWLADLEIFPHLPTVLLPAFLQLFEAHFFHFCLAIICTLQIHFYSSFPSSQLQIPLRTFPNSWRFPRHPRRPSARGAIIAQPDHASPRTTAWCWHFTNGSFFFDCPQTAQVFGAFTTAHGSNILKWQLLLPLTLWQGVWPQHSSEETTRRVVAGRCFPSLAWGGLLGTDIAACSLGPTVAVGRVAKAGKKQPGLPKGDKLTNWRSWNPLIFTLSLAFIKIIFQIQPVSLERFNFNNTEFFDGKHFT